MFLCPSHVLTQGHGEVLRWGRSEESFSEHPDAVRIFVRGFLCADFCVRIFCADFRADFCVRIFVWILDFLRADFGADFEAVFYEDFWQGDRGRATKNPSKNPPKNPPQSSSRIPPRIFARQPPLDSRKITGAHLGARCLSQLFSIPLSGNIGQWLMQV